jgi:hypothetical protein
MHIEIALETHHFPYQFDMQIIWLVALFGDVAPVLDDGLALVYEQAVRKGFTEI